MGSFSRFDLAGLGSGLILSSVSQRISIIMVNLDPFSTQANFLSRVFCIAFLMLEINCLYLVASDYVEVDWVILNSVCLGLMLINSIGSFTL